MAKEHIDLLGKRYHIRRSPDPITDDEGRRYQYEPDYSDPPTIWIDPGVANSDLLTVVLEAVEEVVETLTRVPLVS